jgi:tetratricopeptide (TPR) repeat protein
VPPSVPRSEQEVLLERLSRHPPGRYPVQHATTQFHLGSVLLQAGQLPAALQALSVARWLFARAGLRLEAAKATLMEGIAHRSAGNLPLALAAFTAAEAELAALDASPERGAAAYDLGLVRQDLGDRDAAHRAWATAREAFLAGGHRAQAAAAARDHGASLLAAGDAAAAVPLLEQAAALAERAGDGPGAAAAANVLGLAHLAVQDSAAAVRVLRRALAFAPRATRPADHALVKANLALAHEQEGDLPRARLAAVQALSIPSADAAVRGQAQSLLARLPGRPSDDLLAVLDVEDQDAWLPLVREEAVRTADLPDDRRALVRALLDSLLARPETAYDRAQVLLAVTLELPPRAYEGLVAAVVGGCSGRPRQDEERLRAVLSSALARFAVPQWQRLAASLNAAAEQAGEPAAWR